MKIHIAGKYHHKNQNFLNFFKKDFILTNYEDAEIVLSPRKYFSNNKNKKYIYGPHFSVFPNKNLKINKKNEIYIQPSDWVLKLWKNLNSNINLYSIPFGVDTNKFKPDNEMKRDSILIYHKHRSDTDLKFITNFFDKKKINYKVFSYKNRYDENDYLKYLNTCKYGIWVGAHESQGFALQECLSMNVPLLVWNIKRMNQEYGCEEKYKAIKTIATSIPYWSDLCGEYFFNESEFNSKYNIFINNLKKYKPREFILQNLSNEICQKKWELLIKEIKI